MKQQTWFGRKPSSLLLSLALLVACPTAFYYVYQANNQLKPFLPPLAAQRNLQQWLEISPEQLMQTNPLYHLDLVTDIYRQTNFQLLWFDHYELSEAGRALLQQLQDTSADNLIDYHYHIAYLQQRLYQLPTRPKDATAIDILLTDAFVSYAEDVLNKQLLPEQIALTINKNTPWQKTNFSDRTKLETLTFSKHDQHGQIAKLITENTNLSALAKNINSLAPLHEGYERLREALNFYQSLALSGQWFPLLSEANLKQGDRHNDVADLRELLYVYGDYPVPKNKSIFNWFGSKKSKDIDNENSDFFDPDLEASVKFFQQRHGLKDSGVLDKQTRNQLNISPSKRIKQIAFNMKRWRELPNELGDRYIWVNLTDFNLDVYEKNQSVLNMKVIVGKKSRRTPVLFEPMNTLVLNPKWNVPRRIMVRDILPQAKKDPTYLTQRNIRIINGWQEQIEIPAEEVDLNTTPLHRFPYRLQQDAGEDNALGVVKFVLPNDDSIYLHDTNSRSLFTQHDRALSSGCVRVEKPLELAALLLKGKKGLDRDKIDQILAEGQTTYVKLPETIPTYLAYWTSWVDAEGTLHFRDDIYQRDSILEPSPSEYQDVVL